jgi:hypothetical protein
MADIKKFFFLIVLSAALSAGAYSASSSNYILQSDSVNFGGGYSTSSAYRMQDTAGEIATGILSSTKYIMSAGYQAMNSDVYVALSAPADITLAPALNGVGGGTSDGSSDWAVQTDNPAGYELSIRSVTDPALSAGANYFGDYVPSYAEPDYAWNTPVTESRFGFSPEGDEIVRFFKDDGLNCGSGALDTPLRCWFGLSTSNRAIAREAAANVPLWSTTTIRFRAEIGSKKPQALGNYSATVVVTVVTL